MVMNDEEKTEVESKNIQEDDNEKNPKTPLTLEENVDIVIKRVQGLTSSQMFSACVIAFSLGTLLMLVSGWALQQTGIELNIPIILGINIIPTMVGSFVSSFLFIRRSRTDHLVNGIKIGFGGFVISYVYTSVLALGGGGAYIMIGFLIGGVLGGLTVKKIYN
jgi:hypothetical protein